jgi:hypothetical protein
LKRLVILLVVVAAATVAWVLALPPRAPEAAAPLPAGVRAPARGAIHVHTRRSDGSGTVESIAAAAARAGLQFVILTDHGDATRQPARPAYESGVLMIDAVEISTDGGHLVALGLPQAPYPLAGEPRDVVEDVARLGGFGIAAHPTSAKPELRWSEWSVPVGGLEWLNMDSEWRDESRLTLARAFLTYPARPSESVAALLDGAEEALRIWDEQAATRRIVAVAAADAHARLGLRSLGEPYESRALLALPSYESVFRAFSIALPGVALGGAGAGDAAGDAAAVIAAIRDGRVYSTVTAVGGPAAFDFSATADAHVTPMGGALPMIDTVTLHVAVQVPGAARLVLRRNGVEAMSTASAAFDYTATEPGAYRVEVLLPGAPGQPPVPWIVSNPIYVGVPGALAPPPPAPVPSVAPREATVRYGDGPASDWSVEVGAQSKAVIDRLKAVAGDELGFRFGLGGAESDSPYAAMVMPAGPIDGFGRLLFTAHASRPMRISVQLRAPGTTAGERWRRSVFLDTTTREITIAFDDMRPAGVTSTPRPDLARVQSVLFVVDTVNAVTGTNGQFVIDDVKYAR